LLTMRLIIFFASLLFATSRAQTDVDFHEVAFAQRLNQTQEFPATEILLRSSENEDGKKKLLGLEPIVTIAIGFVFGATFAFLSWMLIFNPPSLSIRESTVSSGTHNYFREKNRSKRRSPLRSEVPKPVGSAKRMVPVPVPILQENIPLNHELSRQFIIQRLRQYAMEQNRRKSQETGNVISRSRKTSAPGIGEFHVPKRESSDDSDTSSCLSVKIETRSVQNRPIQFYMRSYSRPRSPSSSYSLNVEYGGILYE